MVGFPSGVVTGTLSPAFVKPESNLADDAESDAGSEKM